MSYNVKKCYKIKILAEMSKIDFSTRAVSILPNFVFLHFLIFAAKLER